MTQRVRSYTVTVLAGTVFFLRRSHRMPVEGMNFGGRRQVGCGVLASLPRFNEAFRRTKVERAGILKFGKHDKLERPIIFIK